MSSIQAAHEHTSNLPDQNDRCGDAESSIVPSQGQGHRLRRLLIAQVAHRGSGSRDTDSPNWFQASRYSILHSSLSSAESRYHCLQTREQLRRSTQSSCENTRAITCAGARSAAAESPRTSCSSSPCRGGAMADPPARPPRLLWTSGLQKPRSIRYPLCFLWHRGLKNWRRRSDFYWDWLRHGVPTRFVDDDEGRNGKERMPSSESDATRCRLFVPTAYMT